jgi:phage-related protein
MPPFQFHINNLTFCSFVLVDSALEVLSKQRAQAQKDIAKLERLKKDALKDPFGFVDILLNDVRKLLIFRAQMHLYYGRRKNENLSELLYRSYKMLF